MITQATYCFRTIVGQGIGCLIPIVPKQCSNNIFGVIGNKLWGEHNVPLCGVERDPNNPKKCQMKSNKYVIAETNEIYQTDKYDDIIPYSFQCPTSGVRMVQGAYNPMNDAENNAYITLKCSRNGVLLIHGTKHLNSMSIPMKTLVSMGGGMEMVG